MVEITVCPELFEALLVVGEDFVLNPKGKDH